MSKYLVGDYIETPSKSIYVITSVTIDLVPKYNLEPIALRKGDAGFGPFKDVAESTLSLCRKIKLIRMPL